MRITSASLLIVVVALLATAQTRSVTQAQPLVFTHVAVIDMTGAPPKPNMTVMVTGDRITSLEQTGKVRPPKSAQVVDATGKFLIPGLWDMHTHLSFYGAAALSMLIANGVTGVRDMGGDLIQLDGWKMEMERGARTGPRITRAGPFVDGAKEMSPLRASTTIIVGDAEDARRTVTTLKRRGVDFIKVHNGVSREAYLALVDECRKQNVPLAAHLPRSVRAAEASGAGASSLDHMETLLESIVFGDPAKAISPEDALREFTDEKAAELFTSFAKNNTWFAPNLVGYRAFARAGTSKEAVAGRQKLLTRFVQLAGIMHRSNVGMLAATDFASKDDSPRAVRPGFDLHDELALFVEAGMTPLQALQTATRDPAKYLNRLNTLGTIEKGKFADLVLLDANPLEQISNTKRINAVVVNGRYLPTIVRTVFDKKSQLPVRCV